MIYEHRAYDIAPGAAGVLHQRFREHTVRLMRRHGHLVVGVWQPVVGRLNALHYLLAWEDFDTRTRRVAEFEADPEWQAAFAATPGLTVQRTSELWAPTDYAPALSLHWPDGTVESA